MTDPDRVMLAVAGPGAVDVVRAILRDAETTPRMDVAEEIVQALAARVFSEKYARHITPDLAAGAMPAAR